MTLIQDSNEYYMHHNKNINNFSDSYHETVLTKDICIQNTFVRLDKKIN